MSNGLPINQIIEGDCLEVMRAWPDACVHCVVTSPPYWGLRDYKIEMSIWGGDAECRHEWGMEQIIRQQTSHTTRSNLAEAANKCDGGRRSQANRADNNLMPKELKRGCWCQKCGAWRGCYGLEPTVELFVEHTVTIFREVRRVLRPDGTLWLNLGDTYTSGGRDTHGTRIGYKQESNTGCLTVSELRPECPAGLKPKDLVGIPWRVAFALQADGWYLRQDIIWHKPNPMPESVTDRCTKAHEYIFLLAKSSRYFYDAETVKEPIVEHTAERIKQEAAAGMVDKYKQTPYSEMRQDAGNRHNQKGAWVNYLSGRNKRSVWRIAAQGTSDAHFATFPPELVRPCIRAGTSAKGCCPQCGAPWKRVVSKERVAAQEGRNYVMIERNPEYVAMARRTRLAPVETAVPLKEAKAGQRGLFESSIVNGKS